MSDDSVFGGLEEIASAGAHAVVDAAQTVGNVADAGMYGAHSLLDDAAAGAMDFVGAHSTANEIQQDSAWQGQQASSSLEMAGENASEAYHDVVGDTEIDPSMLYNEFE